MLILASQSPRRKELLGLLNMPFAVRVADIDEAMDEKRPPFDEVARVSRRKAEAVERKQDDVVIAADTIVVCEGKVLGKPRTEDEAKAMLSLLLGALVCKLGFTQLDAPADKKVWLRRAAGALLMIGGVIAYNMGSR